MSTNAKVLSGKVAIVTGGPRGIGLAIAKRLTAEARFVHWSCARIHNPNLGLNGVTGFLGVTFFL